MAATFNMLRANDLIWSFYVRNYLLGKDPFPFDLLYWNADSTRLPAKMHSTYLRTMYLKNEFREPGGLSVAGIPIDVSAIQTPAYFISTEEDHIAPGRAPTWARNCCPGRSGSYLASQAILPASSTRLLRISTAITQVPGLTSRPLNGAPMPIRTPVPGGRTGRHGWSNMPVKKFPRAAPAPTVSLSSKMRRAVM